MTKPEIDYIDSLMMKFLQKRTKRQATRRVRREYRTLSTQERNNYHQAVRALKSRAAVSLAQVSGRGKSRSSLEQREISFKSRTAESLAQVQGLGKSRSSLGQW